MRPWPRWPRVPKAKAPRRRLLSFFATNLRRGPRPSGGGSPRRDQRRSHRQSNPHGSRSLGDQGTKGQHARRLGLGSPEDALLHLPKMPPRKIGRLGPLRGIRNKPRRLRKNRKMPRKMPNLARGHLRMGITHPRAMTLASVQPTTFARVRPMDSPTCPISGPACGSSKSREPFIEGDHAVVAHGQHARSSSADDRHRNRSADFEHRHRGRRRTRQVVRAPICPQQTPP